MTLPTKLIKWVAFLDLLAVGLIVPLTSSHARRLGASHISVGLLGSVYAGFQLFSGPLIGSLSDLRGRKRILLLTLIICGVTYTLTGLTDSVMCIIFLRAVLGVFKQTQMLTRAMVPDYEECEQRQSEIYGEMAAISGIGFTMGPVIGGHIQEKFPDDGFRYVAISVGVCFILNAGLVYYLPNVTAKVDTKKTRRRTTRTGQSQNVYRLVTLSLKQSVIELTKVNWSIYWDVLMLKALIGFAMGVYFSNYSLYLKTTYALTPIYIGYIISFQGVVGSLSSYYMGFINSLYCNDNDYSLRNLHVFVLISLSLLGIILSFNIYLYILWLIPLAVGNAVGRLITLEVILKRCHGEHRGTLIGASNSVRSLSGVVAPMVAGVIGQYYGVSYVIYSSLCATLLGLGMSFHTRYYKRIKQD